jgi:hypothetical protein
MQKENKQFDWFYWDISSSWLLAWQERGSKVVQVTYPRTANNEKELTVSRGEYLEVMCRDNMLHRTGKDILKGQLFHILYFIFGFLVWTNFRRFLILFVAAFGNLFVWILAAVENSYMRALPTFELVFNQKVLSLRKPTTFRKTCIISKLFREAILKHMFNYSCNYDVIKKNHNRSCRKYWFNLIECKNKLHNLVRLSL